MRRFRSMIRRIVYLGIFCMIGISGCAATTRTTQLAGLPESVCRHCNCLMPAGLDLQAKCSVCDCGKQNHACVRQ